MGQLYSSVHLVHTLRFTFGTNAMHAIPHALFYESMSVGSGQSLARVLWGMHSQLGQFGSNLSVHMQE